MAVDYLDPNLQQQGVDYLAPQGPTYTPAPLLAPINVTTGRSERLPLITTPGPVVDTQPVRYPQVDWSKLNSQTTMSDAQVNALAASPGLSWEDWVRLMGELGAGFPGNPMAQAGLAGVKLIDERRKREEAKNVMGAEAGPSGPGVPPPPSNFLGYAAKDSNNLKITGTPTKVTNPDGTESQEMKWAVSGSSKDFVSGPQSTDVLGMSGQLGPVVTLKQGAQALAPTPANQGGEPKTVPFSPTSVMSPATPLRTAASPNGGFSGFSSMESAAPGVPSANLTNWNTLRRNILAKIATRGPGTAGLTAESMQSAINARRDWETLQAAQQMELLKQGIDVYKSNLKAGEPSDKERLLAQAFYYESLDDDATADQFFKAAGGMTEQEKAVERAKYQGQLFTNAKARQEIEQNVPVTTVRIGGADVPVTAAQLVSIRNATPAWDDLYQKYVERDAKGHPKMSFLEFYRWANEDSSAAGIADAFAKAVATAQGRDFAGVHGTRLWEDVEKDLAKDPLYKYNKMKNPSTLVEARAKKAAEIRSAAQTEKSAKRSWGAQQVGGKWYIGVIKKNSKGEQYLDNIEEVPQ